MKRFQGDEYIHFVRSNWRLLAFGFLMAFSSSFGQTWFIGLFTPNIERAFGLSHGEWGTIFMVGTLLSAALLVFSGSLIDRLSLKLYSLLVCGLLAIACIAFAATPNAWFLLISVFLLRHAGQGLASHTSITAMVKNFPLHRGKAVAIAAMGFPAARGVLPVLVIFTILAVGWRETYLICAIIVLMLLAPVTGGLLRSHDQKTNNAVSNPKLSLSDQLEHRFSPTLKQVLYKPHIYLIIPGLAAPSFFDTALSFHLLPVAELKSWPANWVTTGYAVYGLATITVSMWTGIVVDKYGSKTIFTYSLIPYVLGILALAFSDGPIWSWVYLGFFGIGSGVRMTLIPVVLSELYGVKHIGAIRSFIATLGVFASAMGPPILGFALDKTITLPTMAAMAIIYFILATGLMMYANYQSRKTLRN